MTNKKTESTEQKEVTIQEPVYAQADLDRADLEIKKLTPEAWLELEDYIRTLDEQTTLPEAGGVAWANIYGKHGGVINLTARATHPIAATNRLLAAVRYLREKQPDVDWTPHSPQSNLPVTYLPPTQPAPVLDVSNPLSDETPQDPQYIPDQLAVSGQPAQAPAATGVMVMDIETISIILKPEGRCGVELFEVGHKAKGLRYPELMIINWKQKI